MTTIFLDKNLDLSTLPTSADLAALVKSAAKYDSFQSSIALKLSWGQLVSNVNIYIDRPNLHPDVEWVGRFVEGDVVVINHREHNRQYHAGGIVGTIFHEWKASFQETYAASDPCEATAEIFRVLWGYHCPENDAWKNNTLLLKEWKGFLKKDPVFKHFLP